MLTISVYIFALKGVYIMKIERINDNQIRCTLSKEDLRERGLEISELAYGSEKAKTLFRDMMQQANRELGFEVGDIPLMVEAIPISTKSLMLIITKIEDPDELDTRFSNFSSFNQSNSEKEDNFIEESYADEILNSFNSIEDNQDLEGDLEEASETIIELSKTVRMAEEELENKYKPKETPNLVRIYRFNSLKEITDLSNVLIGFYHGDNILYKNPKTSLYYLVINKSGHTPEEFNKICNIISEYGKFMKSTYARQSYFDEHYELIVKSNALQILSVF